MFNRITRTSIAAALTTARQACQEHKAWFNALQKAATELESGRWAFTGDTLTIESRSHSGRVYHVTAHGCDCPAGSNDKPCWHRAAHRLLTRAAQLAQQARTTTDRATAMREAAELFA